MAERRFHRNRRRQPVGTSRYGRAALDGELARVEAAPIGARTRTLFAAATHVGQLFAGGEMDDENGVMAALESMGRTVGLPDADVRRTVRRGMALGRRSPRRAPEYGTMLRGRTDALGAVIAWWSLVSADVGGGRRGATRLRILGGLAILATKAGKVGLSESYRQVAEAAGVSVGTIAKYRAELAPWVRVVEKGSRVTGDPTTWQLVVRADGNSPAVPGGYASGLFPKARTLTDPACNTWHRWSCGWRVYCLLGDEGMTATDIAAAAGLSTGGVRRILNRLGVLGLVARDADGCWTAVAERHAQADEGVDHAALRRRRHAAQRAAFRRWRSERLTAREVDIETGEIVQRRAVPRARAA